DEAGRRCRGAEPLGGELGAEVCDPLAADEHVVLVAARGRGCGLRRPSAPLAASARRRLGDAELVVAQLGGELPGVLAVLERADLDEKASASDSRRLRNCRLGA